MTLSEYMAAGGEVVTDKIAAYVDKDVFNNLLKMSYGPMELIPAPEMVTTYTDTVLAINKYKYDTLLASATAEFQSGSHLSSKETHSGSDVQTTKSNSTLNQSGTSSDSTTQNNISNTTSSATGENTTTYGHIIDSNNTTSGKSTPGAVTEVNSVNAYDSDTAVPRDSRTRTEGESTTSQTVTAKDTNSGSDKLNTSQAAQMRTHSPERLLQAVRVQAQARMRVTARARHNTDISSPLNTQKKRIVRSTSQP